MRKIITTLLITTGVLRLSAQLPNVYTPTLIPQTPTTNDIVKVVTKVMTPNNSIIVDMPHTVTATAPQVQIRSCYSMGMLTVIQEHTDTLVLGMLPPGPATVIHKAYLSSTQQHCTRIDSNSITKTFTVVNITGVGEPSFSSLSISPNPFGDVVAVKGWRGAGAVEVFSAEGKLQHQTRFVDECKIDLSRFPAGLYFISVTGGDRKETRKVLKAE